MVDFKVTFVSTHIDGVIKDTVITVEVEVSYQCRCCTAVHAD